MIFYERHFNNDWAGAFRETGALHSFFSRRAHLLTTGRRPAVVSLPLVGLARSARRMRLLREPAANVTVLRDCRHCRCVGNVFSAHFQRLRKPAAGSFVAAMGGFSPPIFFLRKEAKTRNGGENESQSTIWNPRSSVAATGARLLPPQPI